MMGGKRKETKGHRGHTKTLFSTHSVSLERSQQNYSN